MAAFLLFWSVLSVVGVFLAVILVRSGHPEEPQRMVHMPVKPRRKTPASQ